MEEPRREEPVLTINQERLIDHLNETLSVELFAAETYIQYAQQTGDPDIRRNLEEFAADSDRHRAVIADLIADLGGRPNRLKEIATTTLAWGKGFMDIGHRGRQGTLRNLHDLLMVEIKDRSDWEIIKEVGEATGNQRVIDAANEVLPDEQRHVDWLERKAVELARETMIATRVEIK